MKKVYAYLRVSGKGQVKGDGFTRQLEAIQNYATNNNLEVEKVFKEKGVSGAKEVRPALADLMVDLLENGHGITTVIIEKVDRLGRDIMVQEAIIRDFRKNDFNLISALEGPDLLKNDPSRKLMRQLLGVIAEYEKDMLVEKLRSARERQRKKTGKCEGRKTISESNPDLVKEIKKLRRKPRKAKRLTWDKIAEKLNDTGFKNSEGNALSGKAVHAIYSRITH
jgi:DNA invertase Pin-like site-specific DNA recombinase